MKCSWCSAPDPVRDSRGRCRNCGGTLPEQPAPHPRPGFDALIDFYKLTGPAYYGIDAKYLRTHFTKDGPA